MRARMQTVRILCESDDCEEGATHLFPKVGEKVIVRRTARCRIVGWEPESYLRFDAGQHLGWVVEVAPWTHQVIVESPALPGSTFAQVVWVDIHDIAGLPKEEEE